jgi:regulator of protease activity HflC (stomatin/prohibitin superfamily)
LAAEGEQRASRALKQAADIMIQSPAAIQLRYLQTLNSIAGERNSTIVFKTEHSIYLESPFNKSIGSGKTMVEFLSPAMLLRVCKYRS